MRKREFSISVWLTVDEAERLRTYAKLCGFTVSALIRILLRGYCPKPNPPESFWAMLNEVYSIHDSFRTTAESGIEVSENAREAQKQTAEFILKLQAAVTLPQKAVKRYGDYEHLGD